MVGFGDKIAAQVVPEWRKKYIRYGYLAGILDKLPIIAHHSAAESNESSPNASGELEKTKAGSSDIQGRINAVEVELKERQNDDLNANSSSGSSPRSTVVKQMLVCTPFKTKILVSLKHGDDMVLSIDCWRFDLGPSCNFAGPEEVDFLRELNEDISTVVDFQARILCQCIEEFDLLQTFKSHITDLDPAHSQLPLPNKSLLGMTSAMLEKENLLSAYEQLYKLTKYLESYMEGNRQALIKILKKHDKHSHCGNGHDLLVAIDKGRIAFPADDDPSAARRPAVPLLLNLAFLRGELIEQIEREYLDLRHSVDPSVSRHAALTALRGRAGLERRGHSHRDTFLVGLLLGVSVPLVLYSFAVVIGDRDIYNSPLWPVGWGPRPWRPAPPPRHRTARSSAVAELRKVLFRRPGSHGCHAVAHILCIYS